MNETTLKAISYLIWVRKEFDEAELPDDVKSCAFEVIGRLEELFRQGRQKQETVDLLLGSLPLVDHIGPTLRAVKKLA